MSVNTAAELNYQAARLTIQRMLQEGVISEDAAERLQEKFLKRYQPSLGTFLHATDTNIPKPIMDEEETECRECR